MKRTSSIQRKKEIFYFNNNVKIFSTNQEFFVQPKSFIKISLADEKIDKLFEFTEPENPESFHQAIRPIIKISQLFGLFPITGSDSDYPETLYFNYKSFRVLYSVFVLIILAGTFWRSFLYLISSWLHMNSCCSHTIGLLISTLLAGHFGLLFLKFFIFFRLPSKWIHLQHEWKKMEKKLQSSGYGYPPLKLKFKIITIILISTNNFFYAVGDHFLILGDFFASFIWAFVDLSIITIWKNKFKVTIESNH